MPVVRIVSVFFSISHEGSDKCLFAWDCGNLINYRKTHTKHWSSSDLKRLELFFGVFGFLLSLKLLWGYETADNFVLLRVSVNHFEVMRKERNSFKW